MAGKLNRIALTLTFATTAVAFAIYTVKAAPIPAPAQKKAFDKAWQKKAPPPSVEKSERAYDDTRSIEPAIMRIHRAADGYVLFAKPVSPEEEKVLLQQGFRAEKQDNLIRDRSIFNHEVYVGYMVGIQGPSDAELKRLLGTTVKARFKAYRGIGSPMVVDVTPHRP